jgi:hypothetical protein
MPHKTSYSANTVSKEPERIATSREMAGKMRIWLAVLWIRKF